RRPGVRAKNSQTRRQIVAVFAQEGDLPGFWHGIALPPHTLIIAKLILNLADPAPPILSCTLDPADQPSADVTTAGNRRKIGNLRQHFGLRQALQESEVERSAANPAARKGHTKHGAGA